MASKNSPHVLFLLQGCAEKAITKVLSEAQVKAFRNIKSWGKLFLQSSDVLHSPFTGPPCGRPTEAACRAVSHSNSVPVGSERNNGLVWLMGERNSGQSSISMSYYHTVCSLSYSSLSLNHILPTLVHSDSNQLPHPHPPVNIHFKHIQHTLSHSNAYAWEGEREISKHCGKSVWKQWMFTRRINGWQLNHLVNYNSGDT